MVEKKFKPALISCRWEGERELEVKKNIVNIFKNKFKDQSKEENFNLIRQEIGRAHV